MKLYFSMPRSIQPFYERELKEYAQRLNRGEYVLAWHHLERAHILGQQWPVAHTHVHWLMLKFGFRIKSAREIAGQIPRLLLGGVKSFVGQVPLGNTGGANVPPLRPMEIPDDLAVLLK